MKKAPVSIAPAVSLALSAAPTTPWEPAVCYDYDFQILPVETIRSQFDNEAKRAAGHVMTALSQWCLTGNWPAFRKAPLFFIREILEWAADFGCYSHLQDFPTTPPPWDAKYAADFLSHTAIAWYFYECPKWTNRRAYEELDFQKARVADYD